MSWNDLDAGRERRLAMEAAEQKRKANEAGCALGVIGCFVLVKLAIGAAVVAAIVAMGLHAAGWL